MKKIFIKAVAVLLVTLSAFEFSVFATPSEELIAAEGEAETKIALNESFQKVLENKDYELYFSKETAEISVICKENGCIWYSNPQNNGEINSSAREKSQIVVYYYENRDLTAIDSFESCIKLEDKLSWSAENDRFTVIYDIGDDSFTGDALPTVLSKERMEKDILSKLSEDDKETVLDRFSLYAKDELDESALKTIKLNFPSIEKHDLYIRSKMPDYIAEEIYEIFRKAGYTAEDLQRDCDDNGIENTYKEKPAFHIELEYTLSDTGLKARVDTSKITFTETYKPCRIEVLPYFAASKGETGYMIVPDGCGAVIEFDNGKHNTNPYWKRFFNEDNALTSEEADANAQVSVLPVFAVSKENGGVLATVDSAYEVAGISADVAGGNNNYNYIHSFFDVFSADQISLSSNEQDKFVLSNDKIISCPIEISYHFLNGEHTYADFALKYRELLVSKGILSDKKKSSLAIGFDFLGTAEVTKRFLGIPYKTVAALTTYSQADELIKGMGIENAQITFCDSLVGGKVQKKADSLKLQNVLGSKKELKKLTDNTELFVSYYGQYASKIKKKDVSMTLSKSKAKRYNYDFISRYVDAKNALNVLSPTKLESYADKIIKSIKSNGIEAVNLLDLGYQLNSDFNSKNSADRYSAKASAQSYLSKVSEAATVSVRKGSIFSLPYADMIKEIPVTSSGYHIEDYSIPFYEIAISGYIPYSVSSLNTAADSRRQFLKAVELGGQLQYTWIYELPDNIADNGTEYYKYLYSNSYDTAKANYKDYSALYSKIDGQSIADHQRISDTLSKTTYENGLTVYVNYSEKSAEIDGITIEANDFTYVE